MVGPCWSARIEDFVTNARTADMQQGCIWADCQVAKSPGIRVLVWWSRFLKEKQKMFLFRLHAVLAIAVRVQALKSFCLDLACGSVKRPKVPWSLLICAFVFTAKSGMLTVSLSLGCSQRWRRKERSFSLVAAALRLLQ